jgi:hypothetical protein
MMSHMEPSVEGSESGGRVPEARSVNERGWQGRLVRSVYAGDVNWVSARRQVSREATEATGIVKTVRVCTAKCTGSVAVMAIRGAAGSIRACCAPSVERSPDDGPARRAFGGMKARLAVPELEMPARIDEGPGPAVAALESPRAVASHSRTHSVASPLSCQSAIPALCLRAGLRTTRSHSPPRSHIEDPQRPRSIHRARLLFIPPVHERVRHLPVSGPSLDRTIAIPTFLMPGKNGLRYDAATLR